ncbi:TPA: hypothetical protein ACGZ99_002420 [Elizabethkingia anophelis]
MEKKEIEDNLMGKIPYYFTFLGVFLSLLSIGAIAFAYRILFF